MLCGRPLHRLRQSGGDDGDEGFGCAPPRLFGLRSDAKRPVRARPSWGSEVSGGMRWQRDSLVLQTHGGDSFGVRRFVGRPLAPRVCVAYIYIYIRIEVCVGVCELLFDKDKLDRLAPVNARALTLVRAAYLRYVAYMPFEFVEYIYEYIHESSRYAHI